MSKETDEERKKRWAANAARSYMTPQMVHAMNMSKYQSQNKYKADFEKNKAKGYTAVSSTPELEHVRLQSERMSVKKYKKQFEENKSKYTQVADNPELERLKKMTELSSQVSYKGKNAIAQTKRRSRDQQNGDSPKKEDYVAKSVIKEEENIEEADSGQQGIGDYGPGYNDQNYEQNYEAEDNGQTDDTQQYSAEDYNSEQPAAQDNSGYGYNETSYDQDQSQEYSGSTEMETGGGYGQEQEEDNVYDNPAADPPEEPSGEDIYEAVDAEDHNEEEDGGNLDDFYATLN